MRDGYDVMITVRGEQVYADGTPDSSELMTQGRLLPLADGLALEYEETEITGMEGTTTRFTLRDGTVTLTREGAVNSQMVFREGRQHSALYETPYGGLTVDIHTARLRDHLSELGGTLEIQYALSVQQRMISRNCFQIRVKRTNLRQDIRSAT